MTNTLFIKKISILFLFSLSLLFGVAQSNSVELSHYVFPEFTKGIVLMKSTAKNEALLNYNSLTQEMIFDNNGTKMALGQLPAIDTVFINNAIFFPLNGKFVELLIQSKYDLYAEHKCNVKEPGKPSGYGGTSQVSSSNVVSTFLSGSRAYDLKLPDGYDISPFTDYLLKKDGKITEFTNLKQLTKLFSEKNDLIKEYIKKNDVKYDKQQSLIELIKFLETK